MKQKIIPIVSIIVGLLAFGLTYRYLANEKNRLKELEQKIYKGARQVDIIVASHAVPQGTALKQTDVAKKKIYEIEISNRGRMVTVEDVEMVLGKKTLFSIEKGDPLFWSDIEGGEIGGMALASMVKPGMRAISLDASGSAAVSSMILPNDRVDVLGTFSFPSKTVMGEMETVTLTILQDVTILATGQTLANQKKERSASRSTSYSSLTIEVTPRESELLVFAQQMRGKLTLSLRNPSDMSFEEDLPEINFKYLESKLPELNYYRQTEIRHKKGIKKITNQ